MYTYIYTCVYIYTYLHADFNIYIHTYIYVSVYIHMYLYVYIYVCTDTRTHAHLHTQTRTVVIEVVNTHADRETNKHTHTHKQVYTEASIQIYKGLVRQGGKGGQENGVKRRSDGGGVTQKRRISDNHIRAQRHTFQYTHPHFSTHINRSSRTHLENGLFQFRLVAEGQSTTTKAFARAFSEGISMA